MSPIGPIGPIRPIGRIGSIRSFRLRWFVFLCATFALGSLLGAPGWLPQLGFLRETARPEGLPPQQVLAGSIGSPAELLRALAGDGLTIQPASGGSSRTGVDNHLSAAGFVADRIGMRLAPEPPWADAESTAWIGVIALVLAGFIPRPGPQRRLWIACWIAALVTIALSLRVVMAPLLSIVPAAGIFHDPRRWLGATQWLLILASALSVDSWLDVASIRFRSAQRGKNPKNPRHPQDVLSPNQLETWNSELETPSSFILHPSSFLLLPRLPAIALWLILLIAGLGGGLWMTMSLAVAAFALLAPIRWRFARAGALVIGLALAGLLTWTTTDLKSHRARDFLSPTPAPLVIQANLQPGERFFTIFPDRGAVYAYQLAVAYDWMLPNLPMVWGLEDLGGYEPAQSRRYRSFIREIHAADPQRQPYPEHFGLIVNPAARAAFDAANVRVALTPPWGTETKPDGLLKDDFLRSPDWDRFWEEQSSRNRLTLQRYGGNPSWTAWGRGAGKVLGTEITANRITLEVEVDRATNGAAELAVHDAYWPGWKAWIDGETPAEVRPYGLWRVVSVPPGRHTITMTYRPAALLYSLTLACLAAILLLAGAFVALRRARTVIAIIPAGADS